MRAFVVDARYARYIESTLAVTLAEIGRDIERRADEYPGVRALATVPPQYIDSSARGSLTILVGAAPDPIAAADLLLTAGATL